MALTASHAPAEPQSNAASGQSQYFTVACPGSGCHQNCPLRTEVRDGCIVRIDAMLVPGAPEDTHACSVACKVENGLDEGINKEGNHDDNHAGNAAARNWPAAAN